MQFYLILLTAAAAVNCHVHYDKDTEILRKCLAETSKNNVLVELEKVTHYSNWTVEEVPCFTRCVAEQKGWFNAVDSKWIKQKLADDLGENIYNYCRYELDRASQNACEFAHKGLRCLKQAERYTEETFKNLLNCATDLEASMEQMQKYAEFPATEEIPCLFQCFAKRMNLYTPEDEWIAANWVKAFGPTKHEYGDTSECKATTEKKQKFDKCVWMYEEYTCLERIYYNTDGSYSTFKNASNNKKVRPTEAAEEVEA